MTETYNGIDHLLSDVNNQEHKWLICGDIKVVGRVQGIQHGSQSILGFLCLWDSRTEDQHYIWQEWLLR